MIADFIICCTLLVNAGAVLNFKLKRKSSGETFGEEEPSAKEKAIDFLLNLRYFRIFIGLWNLVIVFLMFVFFSG